MGPTPVHFPEPPQLSEALGRGHVASWLSLTQIPTERVFQNSGESDFGDGVTLVPPAASPSPGKSSSSVTSAACSHGAVPLASGDWPAPGGPVTDWTTWSPPWTGHRKGNVASDAHSTWGMCGELPEHEPAEHGLGKGRRSAKKRRGEACGLASPGVGGPPVPGAELRPWSSPSLGRPA